MGKLTGFDSSAEIRRIAQQAVIPAVDETSDAMVVVAATVARKDTGRMAAGWYRVPAQLVDSTTVRGGIQNDVEYTYFQDRGTDTITPNNMSGAAIDAEAPALPDRIRSRL